MTASDASHQRAPMTSSGDRHDHRFVVAIDGPAAAGKTTVAQALAERLGAIFLDTGLLYRAVTVAALEAGVDPNDGDALAALIRGSSLHIQPASTADGRALDVLVDGQDITTRLRTPEVDRNVSAVAEQAEVRRELLPVQRRIADGGRVVMVGRDIGTVVVPDAGVKLYLDASAEERARRRHRELVLKGLDIDYETVLDDLKRRDAIDSGREAAPLTQAPDAVLIDSNGKAVDEVVSEMAAHVERVWTA